MMSTQSCLYRVRTSPLSCCTHTHDGWMDSQPSRTPSDKQFGFRSDSCMSKVGQHLASLSSHKVERMAGLQARLVVAGSGTLERRVLDWRVKAGVAIELLAEAQLAVRLAWMGTRLVPTIVALLGTDMRVKPLQVVV
mmetsp:Transcript_56059/g.148898  ORF Transcript_56059/g.148898 Transcript_56059/m.148898 type:complete len:137 (+) Transcript_56059:417-827(+)